MKTHLYFYIFFGTLLFYFYFKPRLAEYILLSQKRKELYNYNDTLIVQQISLLQENFRFSQEVGEKYLEINTKLVEHKAAISNYPKWFLTRHGIYSNIEKLESMKYALQSLNKEIVKMKAQ